MKNQPTHASQPTTPAPAKAAAHSPCTLAVAACRLAAIAAIADPVALVARAYAAEALRQLGLAEAAAADDTKDRRQCATARRWVLAADTAAASDLR